MTQLIGIDIGGTNLRVGVVEDGRIIHEQRTHADFSGICRTHAPAKAWQIIIETLAGALRPVLDSHPQVASVGIGFPGFIDPVSGNIAQSPNLPAIWHLPWVVPLSSKTTRWPLPMANSG